MEHLITDLMEHFTTLQHHIPIGELMPHITVMVEAGDGLAEALDSVEVGAEVGDGGGK